MAKRNERDGAAADGPPLIERLLALVGLVMVSLVLAMLIYLTVNGDGAPPDVRVRPVAVSEQGERFLLRFEASNAGDRTAAAVSIHGRLSDAVGRLVEEAEVELDYVPSRSVEEGGLYFRHDPRSLQLDLRAAGYAEP